MSLGIVIMAAGKGTRLKSKRPKVLHSIGGMPLLGHVIAAASQVARPSDLFVVVGHRAKEVEAAVAATGVGFVHQAEQLGTGHAIQCAAPVISEYSDVVVLSGDVPLIRSATIEALLALHRQESAAMTILTASPAEPHGYGRIVRSGAGPEVQGIVEQKSLAPGQESIREINSGIYVFRVAALIRHLHQLTAGNSQKEFYLTDMAALLRAAGKRVVALEAGEPNEVLGANTIAELVALDATLRNRTAHSLMAQGVTIFRPESCVIDSTVVVEADTIIEPYVQLLGRTRIGPDCKIRSGTVIEDSTIGAGVVIRQSCIIVESSIGEGAQIGPFAHLRPGSEIGPEAHVGNFVETKKTKMGRGAKANHLSYLGDAEIGAGSNVGAGVITCNYDGISKHPTRIGEGAFIGSDSTLVAPITVGAGAYIGAGSCITRDVPPDALAVGRSREVIKEGWAASRRAGGKQEC